MMSFRVYAIASALLLASVVPSHAQFKMSKEAIQAAVAAQMAKEGKEGGSNARGASRRDSGGAKKKKNEEVTSWADFKAIKGSMGKKEKAAPKSWAAFRATAGPPARDGVQNVIDRIIKKQITVIAGTRVTDAITGELLDDAREIRVDEEKKSEYFDDGTHGDLVAGDGQYTRVEEITGVLGPNNQRIKEQMVQAVYEISRLDAVEFYGHTLLSADHSTRPERNVRWAMVEGGEDSIGYRFSEIATEKTVEVPSYWNEEMSRDEKIAGPNGWARTFLDEYRLTKGGIDSNFYPPYVPEPPTIPKLPPPQGAGWSPFVATAAGTDATGAGGTGKKKGAVISDKWLAATQKAAGGFVNRGAGAGSASSGYFKAE